MLVSMPHVITAIVGHEERDALAGGAPPRRRQLLLAVADEGDGRENYPDSPLLAADDAPPEEDAAPPPPYEADHDTVTNTDAARDAGVIPEADAADSAVTGSHETSQSLAAARAESQRVALQRRMTAAQAAGGISAQRRVAAAEPPSLDGDDNTFNAPPPLLNGGIPVAKEMPGGPFAAREGPMAFESWPILSHTVELLTSGVSAATKWARLPWHDDANAASATEALERARTRAGTSAAAAPTVDAASSASSGSGSGGGAATAPRPPIAFDAGVRGPIPRSLLEELYVADAASKRRGDALAAELTGPSLACMALLSAATTSARSSGGTSATVGSGAAVVPRDAFFEPGGTLQLMGLLGWEAGYMVAADVAELADACSKAVSPSASPSAPAPAPVTAAYSYGGYGGYSAPAASPAAKSPAAFAPATAVLPSPTPSPSRRPLASPLPSVDAALRLRGVVVGLLETYYPRRAAWGAVTAAAPASPLPSSSSSPPPPPPPAAGVGAGRYTSAAAALSLTPALPSPPPSPPPVLASSPPQSSLRPPYSLPRPPALPPRRPFLAHGGRLFPGAAPILVVGAGAGHIALRVAAALANTTSVFALSWGKEDAARWLGDGAPDAAAVGEEGAGGDAATAAAASSTRTAAWSSAWATDGVPAYEIASTLKQVARAPNLWAGSIPTSTGGGDSGGGRVDVLSDLQSLIDGMLPLLKPNDVDGEVAQQQEDADADTAADTSADGEGPEASSASLPPPAAFRLGALVLGDIGRLVEGARSNSADDGTTGEQQRLGGPRSLLPHEFEAALGRLLRASRYLIVPPALPAGEPFFEYWSSPHVLIAAAARSVGLVATTRYAAPLSSGSASSSSSSTLTTPAQPPWSSLVWGGSGSTRTPFGGASAPATMNDGAPGEGWLVTVLQRPDEMLAEAWLYAEAARLVGEGRSYGGGVLRAEDEEGGDAAATSTGANTAAAVPVINPKGALPASPSPVDNLLAFCPNLQLAPAAAAPAASTSSRASTASPPGTLPRPLSRQVEAALTTAQSTLEVLLSPDDALPASVAGSVGMPLRSWLSLAGAPAGQDLETMTRALLRLRGPLGTAPGSSGGDADTAAAAADAAAAHQDVFLVGGRLRLALPDGHRAVARALEAGERRLRGCGVTGPSSGSLSAACRTAAVAAAAAPPVRSAPPVSATSVDTAPDSVVGAAASDGITKKKAPSSSSSFSSAKGSSGAAVTTDDVAEFGGSSSSIGAQKKSSATTSAATVDDGIAKDLSFTFKRVSSSKLGSGATAPDDDSASRTTSKGGTAKLSAGGGGNSLDQSSSKGSSTRLGGGGGGGLDQRASSAGGGFGRLADDDYQPPTSKDKAAAAAAMAAAATVDDSAPLAASGVEGRGSAAIGGGLGAADGAKGLTGAARTVVSGDEYFADAASAPLPVAKGKPGAGAAAAAAVTGAAPAKQTKVRPAGLVSEGAPFIELMGEAPLPPSGDTPAGAALLPPRLGELDPLSGEDAEAEERETHSTAATVGGGAGKAAAAKYSAGGGKGAAAAAPVKVRGGGVGAIEDEVGDTVRTTARRPPAPAPAAAGAQTAAAAQRAAVVAVLDSVSGEGAGADADASDADGIGALVKATAAPRAAAAHSAKQQQRQQQQRPPVDAAADVLDVVLPDDVEPTASSLTRPAAAAAAAEEYDGVAPPVRQAPRVDAAAAAAATRPLGYDDGDVSTASAGSRKQPAPPAAQPGTYLRGGAAKEGSGSGKRPIAAAAAAPAAADEADEDAPETAAAAPAPRRRLLQLPARARPGAAGKATLELERGGDDETINAAGGAAPASDVVSGGGLFKRRTALAKPAPQALAHAPPSQRPRPVVAAAAAPPVMKRMPLQQELPVAGVKASQQQQQLQQQHATAPQSSSSTQRRDDAFVSWKSLRPLPRQSRAGSGAASSSTSSSSAWSASAAARQASLVEREAAPFKAWWAVLESERGLLVPPPPTAATATGALPSPVLIFGDEGSALLATKLARILPSAYVVSVRLPTASTQLAPASGSSGSGSSASETAHVELLQLLGVRNNVLGSSELTPQKVSALLLPYAAARACRAALANASSGSGGAGSSSDGCSPLTTQSLGGAPFRLAVHSAAELTQHLVGVAMVELMSSFGGKQQQQQQSGTETAAAAAAAAVSSTARRIRIAWETRLSSLLLLASDASVLSLPPWERMSASITALVEPLLDKQRAAQQSQRLEQLSPSPLTPWWMEEDSGSDTTAGSSGSAAADADPAAAQFTAPLGAGAASEVAAASLNAAELLEFGDADEQGLDGDVLSGWEADSSGSEEDGGAAADVATIANKRALLQLRGDAPSLYARRKGAAASVVGVGGGNGGGGGRASKDTFSVVGGDSSGGGTASSKDSFSMQQQQQPEPSRVVIAQASSRTRSGAANTLASTSPVRAVLRLLRSSLVAAGDAAATTASGSGSAQVEWRRLSLQQSRSTSGGSAGTTNAERLQRRGQQQQQRRKTRQSAHLQQSAAPSYGSADSLYHPSSRVMPVQRAAAAAASATTTASSPYRRTPAAFSPWSGLLASAATSAWGVPAPSGVRLNVVGRSRVYARVAPPLSHVIAAAAAAANAEGSDCGSGDAVASSSPSSALSTAVTSSMTLHSLLSVGVAPPTRARLYRMYLSLPLPAIVRAAHAAGLRVALPGSEAEWGLGGIGPSGPSFALPPWAVYLVHDGHVSCSARLAVVVPGKTAAATAAAVAAAAGDDYDSGSSITGEAPSAAIPPSSSSLFRRAMRGIGGLVLRGSSGNGAPATANAASASVSSRARAAAAAAPSVFFSALCFNADADVDGTVDVGGPDPILSSSTGSGSVATTTSSSTSYLSSYLTPEAKAALLAAGAEAKLSEQDLSRGSAADARAGERDEEDDGDDTHLLELWAALASQLTPQDTATGMTAVKGAGASSATRGSQRKPGSLANASAPADEADASGSAGGGGYAHTAGAFSFVEHGAGAGELSLLVGRAFPSATVISLESDAASTDAHLAAALRAGVANNAITRAPVSLDTMKALFECPEFFRYQVLSLDVPSLLAAAGAPPPPSSSSSSSASSSSPGVSSRLERLGSLIGTMLGLAATSFLRIPSASLQSLAYTTFSDVEAYPVPGEWVEAGPPGPFGAAAAAVAAASSSSGGRCAEEGARSSGRVSARWEPVPGAGETVYNWDDWDSPPSIAVFSPAQYVAAAPTTARTCGGSGGTTASEYSSGGLLAPVGMRALLSTLQAPPRCTAPSAAFTSSSAAVASASSSLSVRFGLAFHPRPPFETAELRLLRALVRAPAAAGSVRIVAAPVPALARLPSSIDAVTPGAVPLHAWSLAMTMAATTARRAAAGASAGGASAAAEGEQAAAGDAGDDASASAEQQQTDTTTPPLLSWRSPVLPFPGVSSGLVRVDVTGLTRHVNHHFQSDMDGHTRKYTLHVGVNVTAGVTLAVALGARGTSSSSSSSGESRTENGAAEGSTTAGGGDDAFFSASTAALPSYTSLDPAMIYGLLAPGNHPNHGHTLSCESVEGFLPTPPAWAAPPSPSNAPEGGYATDDGALPVASGARPTPAATLVLCPQSHSLSALAARSRRVAAAAAEAAALSPPSTSSEKRTAKSVAALLSAAAIGGPASPRLLAPGGPAAPIPGVTSIILTRDMDGAMIPYDSVHGVTLITVLRLGLLAPLRARAYHAFVSLPLYLDMAPWNIVFMGPSLDYIDYDTRDRSYDAFVVHAYEVMEVLFNYKRTLEDFKKCGGKASNPYGFPFVSECVGGTMAGTFTGPCKDSSAPVPCGDGTCKSDYVACLRSMSIREKGKEALGVLKWAAKEYRGALGEHGLEMDEDAEEEVLRRMVAANAFATGGVEGGDASAAAAAAEATAALLPRRDAAGSSSSAAASSAKQARSRAAAMSLVVEYDDKGAAPPRSPGLRPL